MKNFAAARKNMVECQLETNGIISPEILDAFNLVPREEFLPDNDRYKAYVDEDIEISSGGFVMDPMVFAKMLETVEVRQDDIVLNIGDLTGYSSAILSNLVTTIVTPEPQAGMLDAARRVWGGMDFCNIAVIEAALSSGCPEHGPYSLIIINGAVVDVPDALLEQLAPGGRLVTIIKEKGKPVGAATIFAKDRQGYISRHAVFDASTPYLSDFQPSETFSF